MAMEVFIGVSAVPILTQAVVKRAANSREIVCKASPKWTAQKIAAPRVQFVTLCFGNLLHSSVTDRAARFSPEDYIHHAFAPSLEKIVRSWSDGFNDADKCKSAKRTVAQFDAVA